MIRDVGIFDEIPERDFCPADENQWGEKSEDYSGWTETHCPEICVCGFRVEPEEPFCARIPVLSFADRRAYAVSRCQSAHPHSVRIKQETDMGKPWTHAESSAKMFGGKPEDYLAIHEFMDSSKATMPDNRHRALTHNTWFITTVLDRVFGSVIENSDKKKVPVRDIGEQHCLEDFGGRFVPTVQDYLEKMDASPWMSNGPDFPPSCKRIAPIPSVAPPPGLDSWRNPAHAGAYYPSNVSGPVGSGIPNAYPIAID